MRTNRHTQRAITSFLVFMLLFRPWVDFGRSRYSFQILPQYFCCAASPSSGDDCDQGDSQHPYRDHPDCAPSDDPPRRPVSAHAVIGVLRPAEPTANKSRHPTRYKFSSHRFLWLDCSPYCPPAAPAVGCSFAFSGENNTHSTGHPRIGRPAHPPGGCSADHLLAALGRVDLLYSF